MFPYLTLHDATQTRNKNLLISHCYLTLELGTRLSLVTITRTSHQNTKLARESVFSASDVWRIPLYLLTGAIIMGCWHHPNVPGGLVTFIPMYCRDLITWARPVHSWHKAQTLTPEISSAFTSFAQHCFNSHDTTNLHLIRDAWILLFVVVTQLMNVGVDHDCVLRMLWAGWAVLIS